ncbi:disease resistance protein TAO1-like [Raphanus sativus]|uniref:Disease resistance protein TAO1-like n=1 Tax=Raphanus sativus TaxID=3726 RepID=A0A9W3DS92_RAPSA|nr:disease resistance protein TAO1-like [Raphanus sativus]XP_056866685.1 disease resistance protein TAO1-like [Raphanus sativus]XP_056866686.1 disease resistance protein TAO1-like [Raphanus sativus]XP_056866687.1 disease resistance protein TAO1-like [Raphanus sativus]XP_056866688.1 disease resistance protein TAO1-like [Raphanus sativus]XP_056866689.1 disease resistance protein TAO1-like [Raphanus sativus]XP_056866690.1 disease resistance protein TAO1-like [Raphanus sativus]XP_056866691.1 dis
MTGQTCWFGPQSRIIITTKDKKLLVAHEINHFYRVDVPSTSEALEILCLSAFRHKSPSLGFENMAIEVTRLAGNLPLGLRVFGAYLRGMSRDQWIHALPRLRTSLDGEIGKVLRFSYDALCEEDQELFLHIACFFKGGCISDVVECLAESRLNVNHGLQVLFDKCFISEAEWGWLVVHNLLEQMAKEIVRKQSVSDPGKRQFLVDAQDICDVLEGKAGTETIRGIDFDLSKVSEDLIIDERAFEGMSRLQFLRFQKWGLYNNTKLLVLQGLKVRASKLRFLEWDQFPLTCFPREFQPRRLVKLKMIHSKLEKLWEGPIPLPCLKLMVLAYSNYLKELPDLSNVTNLKVLNACCCSSLSEISSIGKSTSLQELHLAGCSKLIVIPSSIGNAINLKTLNVQQCDGLVELPSSIWSLSKLKKLLTAGCPKLNHLGSQLRSFPDIS